MQMGEISRFCISKDFRRRQGDGMFPASEDPETRSDERRVIPNMTLGLMEGLIRMSLDHGLFYQCAAMERPLLRLLDRLGIRFTHIGPLVDYQGRRRSEEPTSELPSLTRPSSVVICLKTKNMKHITIISH